MEDQRGEQQRKSVSHEEEKTSYERNGRRLTPDQAWGLGILTDKEAGSIFKMRFLP